jgi:hypothetical protein
MTTTQAKAQVYPLVVVLSTLLAAILAAGFVDVRLVGVLTG